MKKLFFSLIMTFIFIFVIWFLIAFIRYNDLTNIHLDLNASISQLNFISNNPYINGDTVFDTLDSFKDAMEELYKGGIFNRLLQGIGILPDNSSFAFGLLTSLIDPILNLVYVVIIGGYVVVLVLELVFLTFNVLIGVYEFIFNPIFIDTSDIVINSQGILEKARDLFGFAFQVLRL